MVDYTILWQNDVVGTITVENLSVASNDMNSILFTNDVPNKPKLILSLKSISRFLLDLYDSDYIRVHNSEMRKMCLDVCEEKLCFGTKCEECPYNWKEIKKDE